MRFSRYNPAQLERIRLATDDGLGCCHVLSERIRAVSGALTDDDCQLFADALYKSTRQNTRPLSRDEAVAFIARPVYIINGHLPMRPKAKKTRLRFSSELRRGVYHTLVRLPVVRRKAKATRLRAGGYYRKIVYPLILEVIKNGAMRPQVRGEVKRLAVKNGIVIPSESQLGRIIKGFFEVDMTT